MSDTILVAIITATPTLIVTFFTSYFQYKINKHNSDKIDKYNVLRTFNKCASNYYSIDFTSYKVEYEEALNDLIIYLPKINTKFINDLETARSLKNWNKYYPVLRKTIKYLSSLI